MLEAVTLSLEAWLRRCVPRAVLCFDEPEREPAAAVAGAPLLRVWLYDVREEDRGRGGGVYVRDAANRSAAARAEPLRVLRHSYRLTAYGEGWRERYRLLEDVVRAGAAVACLPDDLVHPVFHGFGTGALPLVVAPASPVPLPVAAAPAPPCAPALYVAVPAPLRPPADRSVERAPERIDLGTHRPGAPGDGPPAALGRRRTVPRQGRRVQE
ncbi:hypothetical protein [Streptomyces sp. NPDC015131]|uniref:hypothetical protein n=1 Tax=Streptomyces sp. NPDC015131 TaxID=3364941 RepID=UPI003702782B